MLPPAALYDFRRSRSNEHTDALNMRRLREEIDRLNADYTIIPGNEQLEIARQCRRLAGDIDYPRGRKPQELIERLRVAAAPGRIENRRFEGAIKLSQRLLNPTELEAHVGNPVRLCGCAAILDRAGIFFDPYHLGGCGGQRQRERAGATIEIKQALAAAQFQTSAHKRKQSLGGGAVDLKEGGGPQMKCDAAQLLNQMISSQCSGRLAG